MKMCKKTMRKWEKFNKKYNKLGYHTWMEMHPTGVGCVVEAHARKYLVNNRWFIFDTQKHIMEDITDYDIW